MPTGRKPKPKTYKIKRDALKVVGRKRPNENRSKTGTRNVLMTTAQYNAWKASQAVTERRKEAQRAGNKTEAAGGTKYRRPNMKAAMSRGRAKGTK